MQLLVTKLRLSFKRKAEDTIPIPCFRYLPASNGCLRLAGLPSISGRQRSRTPHRFSGANRFRDGVCAAQIYLPNQTKRRAEVSNPKPFFRFQPFSRRRRVLRTLLSISGRQRTRSSHHVSGASRLAIGVHAL